MKTQKNSNNNNSIKIKFNTSWNELFHVQALTDTEPHKFLKLYHTNAACCELWVVSREPHCCCYCKYYASYLLVVFCFVHHGTSAVRWGHVGAAVLLILLLKSLISNKISNTFLFLKNRIYLLKFNFVWVNTMLLISYQNLCINVIIILENTFNVQTLELASRQNPCLVALFDVCFHFCCVELTTLVSSASECVVFFSLSRSSQLNCVYWLLMSTHSHRFCRQCYYCYHELFLSCMSSSTSRFYLWMVCVFIHNCYWRHW